MKYTIFDHETDSRSVTVTFKEGDVTFTRQVNACFTADGQYDGDATAARVEEVARGVANKIALGIITAMPTAEPAPLPKA